VGVCTRTYTKNISRGEGRRREDKDEDRDEGKEVEETAKCES
jgi:hypothetical protein